MTDVEETPSKHGPTSSNTWWIIFLHSSLQININSTYFPYHQQHYFAEMLPWTPNFLIRHSRLFTVFIAQLGQTLCDTIDHSLPGASVHVILQVRMLEWIAIPFSRGSSWLRDWTGVSWIAGRFFTVSATRGAQALYELAPISRSIFLHFPLQSVWSNHTILSIVIKNILVLYPFAFLFMLFFLNTISFCACCKKLLFLGTNLK